MVLAQTNSWSSYDVIKNNTTIDVVFGGTPFFFPLRQFNTSGGRPGEGEVKVGGDETWKWDGEDELEIEE